LAGLTSCVKTYCAQCVELISGYTVDEVCDTEDVLRQMRQRVTSSTHILNKTEHTFGVSFC